MKLAISVGSAYYDGENWPDVVHYVQHADRLGVDTVWSAEAWGMDAVASLAYLAGVTENIKLGSGIMQISARTPAATAMTALSMAQLSNDRFILGLGVSGPQVVEGLHGAPFAKPLGRLREYVDIVRMGLRGERLVYEGEHFVLPRPGGEGKPLKPSIRPRPELPIYLATLGPKSLEFTGEAANGWVGTSFIPEHADVMLAPIARGAEKAGRTLSDLDVQVSGVVSIGDDVDALIQAARPHMAFTLGAMGSASTNFYNNAYSRAGYDDIAAKVRELWVSGDKPAAIAAVPDELVLSAYLLGTEEMVKERLSAYAAAGVTSLRVGARGASPRDQFNHLEQIVGLLEDAGLR